MKKAIILLTALCFVKIHAQSVELTGKIRDEKYHYPLNGCTIFIPSLNIKGKTDKKGKYRLTGIPPGMYKVSVQMKAYKPFTKEVSFKNTETYHLDIFLKPENEEVEQVVVTGVSEALKQKQVPMSIAEISPIQLEAQPDLPEALKNVPGVNLLSTGPAAAKPVIRGLGYNRVLTLYNGVRQEYQQWGAEHGIEIEETGVSRIEIIKGPASLMYGSDALGGVINFISENHTKEGEIKGFFKTQYETNSNLNVYAGEIIGNTNDILWKFDFRKKRAGSYQNSHDGYVFNSGYRNLDFSGSLGKNYKKGSTNLYVSYFKRRLGITEGDRDEEGRFTRLLTDDTGKVLEVPVSRYVSSSNAINFPYQPLSNFLINLKQEVMVGKGKIKLDMAYQKNLRREFGLEDPGSQVEEPIDPELYMKLDTYNYSATYLFPYFGKLRISTGLTGMYQTNQNTGEEAVIPNYNLSDLGGFLYFTDSFGKKLNLAGGLRYDYSKVEIKEDGRYKEDDELKFKNSDNDYTKFTGSLGLTYSLSDHLFLKANAASGFRRPTLEEMAALGVHEGTGHYERGNHDLDPETSTQFDLGGVLNNSNLTFEVSGFYNQINDFIYVQKTGEKKTRESSEEKSKEYEVYAYAQKDARLLGIESSLKIHPKVVPWLHWDNSLSLVDAQFNNYEDKTKDKYISFIPPVNLKSNIKAVFKPKSLFKKLFMSFGIDQTFKQNKVYTQYDTETKTPGYILFNAGIGGFFKNKKGVTTAKLYITANNLFDKAYQSHMSRLKYVSVYEPGRNVSFKLIIPFILKK